MRRTQYTKHFGPVLSALKELGNSGTPDEAEKIVATKLHMPDEVLNPQLNNGTTWFTNQVACAKYYLN